ncbi:hypothetical protein Tco_1145156 [Tanacetum coccineum]
MNITEEVDTSYATHFKDSNQNVRSSIYFVSLLSGWFVFGVDCSCGTVFWDSEIVYWKQNFKVKVDVLYSNDIDSVSICDETLQIKFGSESVGHVRAPAPLA